MKSSTRTTPGHFWHLQLSVIDPKPGEPTQVEIATTRPETMLGDTAVAVHPDPAAALGARRRRPSTRKLAEASEKDRDLIQTQLDASDKRRRKTLPHAHSIRDMARDGRQVMLPLSIAPFRWLPMNGRSPNWAAGCVKITPAHDPNDYEVAIRLRLAPMINILRTDGTLNAHRRCLSRLTTSARAERVVADLDVWVNSVKSKIARSNCPQRSQQDTDRTVLGGPMVRRMDSLAQSAMDAVTNGKSKIFPPVIAKAISIGWAKNEIGQLVVNLVGTSNSNLVQRADDVELRK